MFQNYYGNCIRDQEIDAKAIDWGLDCVARLTEDLEPHIHHIDGNPRNNEISNLVLLCPTCHSEVIELLSEKRRKTFVKKFVKELDKSSFSKKH